MSAEDELFEEEDNSLNRPPPLPASPARRPQNPFRDNAVTLVVLGLLIIVFFYLNSRNEQVFHPRTNSDFLFNANPTPIKKEANFETMPAPIDPTVPQKLSPLTNQDEPIRKISSTPSVNKLSKLKQDIFKLQQELTQDQNIVKKKKIVPGEGQKMLKDIAETYPQIVVNDVEKNKLKGIPLSPDGQLMPIPIEQVAVAVAPNIQTPPEEKKMPIPKAQLTQQEYNSKIFAGEIHYSRIPIQYWQHRILMIKALGLNALSVYVMWNYHELEKGKFDYQTQNKNLTKFLDLAVKHKMKVLIRPGPYVCGEWDFGGLPARLLGIKSLTIRSADNLYLKEVKEYFQSLAPIIKPYLSKNDGPITLLQIENELGSIGSNKEYTQSLVKMWEDLQIECQYYIEDSAKNVFKNYWDGAAVGLSGGNQESQYQLVKKLSENETELYVFGGEIYSGWMTHWGEGWGGCTFERFQQQMIFLITTEKQFSLYVAYGGTNFGLTAGANAGLHGFDYEPAITSYDYDAVITEQGRTTKKYEKMRQWMEIYIINSSISVPEPIQTMQIPAFKPKLVASLLEHKGQSFLNDSSELYFFEHDNLKMYQQGIVVYQTYLKEGLYSMQAAIHDFALLYQDGEFIASFGRIKTDIFDFFINCAQQKCEILIMVEAMGHNNYGQNQAQDIKGMLKCQIINMTTTLKWNLYKIPIDSKILAFDRISKKKQKNPSIFKAIVELNETKDTHIDVKNYQKGYVWVNGRNLGRYWNRGPQYKLYCPGVWLKKGKNEIVILDLLQNEPKSLKGGHHLADPEPTKEQIRRSELVLMHTQFSIPYPIN